MYIVTQNGEIINSNLVVKFSHSLQGMISNYLPKEDEPVFITAHYSGDSKDSDALGAYLGSKKADEVLGTLFNALRDDAETFYMPQP